MLNAADITRFFDETFPHNGLIIEHADGKTARCRRQYDQNQLRPGGTISGPTMMSLADTVAYVLVLSAIGLEPLSVTTNLSINFLRKPEPKDIIAEARMLKLGKALAVCDVLIHSDGSDDVVAHAVVTYSIPPKRSDPAR